MRFARWVFTAAGIYGLLLLTPFLFLERQIAAPAALLARPEYFYGFVLVALACQVLFLLIGRDPARLRPAMIASVIEKLPFGILMIWFWLQGRVLAPLALSGGIDIVWGLLFVVSWLRTPKT